MLKQMLFIGAAAVSFPALAQETPPAGDDMTTPGQPVPTDPTATTPPADPGTIPTDPTTPPSDPTVPPSDPTTDRSEEHTSELQSLMPISYAVFCLKKNTITLKSRHNCKYSELPHPSLIFNVYYQN